MVPTCSKSYKNGYKRNAKRPNVIEVGHTISPFLLEETHMQHLPYYSLDDFEHDKQKMEAFRESLGKEKPAYPDLTLTGEDIHNAYCRIEPDESRPWGSLNLVAQRRYEALAKELNR